MSIKTGLPWQTRHDSIPIQTNLAIFGWQSCNWHNLVECYLRLFRAVTKLIGPFKLAIQHVWTKGFSADADLPDYCHPYSLCVCKAELSPLLVFKSEMFMAVRMNFVVLLNVTPGGGPIGGCQLFREICSYPTQNNIMVPPPKSRCTLIWPPHMMS